MTKIGSEIPTVVDWPPEVTTVEAALSSLDDVYQMNHRGGEIGYYEFEATGDAEGVVECEDPYPAELDEGLLKGTAKKFSDEAAFVRIEQTEEGTTRTFELSW